LPLLRARTYVNTFVPHRRLDGRSRHVAGHGIVNSLLLHNSGIGENVDTCTRAPVTQTTSKFSPPEMLVDEYEEVMDEEDNGGWASGFCHKYNHNSNVTVYMAIFSVYFLVELAVSSSGVLYARARSSIA